MFVQNNIANSPKTSYKKISSHHHIQRGKKNMQTIYTPRAPEPGNYVQAILIDPAKYNILVLSGQTATEEHIAAFESNQIYFQTFHALEHLLAVIQEAHGDIHSFVKLDTYIRDPGLSGDKATAWSSFNVAYRDFFHKYLRDVLPARSCVFVSDVPLPSEKTVIIVTGIAAIPKKRKKKTG